MSELSWRACRTFAKTANFAIFGPRSFPAMKKWRFIFLYKKMLWCWNFLFKSPWHTVRWIKMLKFLNCIVFPLRLFFAIQDQFKTSHIQLQSDAMPVSAPYKFASISTDKGGPNKNKERLLSSKKGHLNSSSLHHS